ncbi:MAG: S1 RNA-binding domain-containing protein [Acholeplasmatales bacterium]|nr:MAG: S1 RNA-binding domain-containing protein [Acholeplasmatales bacterium]
MREGDIVKGQITAIKPYGAFVKVSDTVTGLIHISEFSDRYVRDIKDYVNIGDVLDLKVLSIQDGQKLSLSFKSLHKRKKRFKIKLKSGFLPLETKLQEWIAAYPYEDNDGE